MSKRKRINISKNFDETCKEREGVIEEKCDIVLEWDLETLEKFDKRLFRNIRFERVLCRFLKN